MAKKFKKEDSDIMIVIDGLYKQIEKNIAKLSQEATDEIVCEHSETHGLLHCSRWGAQAAKEIKQSYC